MNRYLGYGSLLLLLGWLGLSYGAWLPDSARLEAPLAEYGGWYQQALLVVLLCFIVIQLWLLRATFRLVRQRSQTEVHPLPTPFALQLWREILWTALPLFMTLGLALVGYKMWANL